LHRAEAGFPVLVLVQGVHPVLVHSSSRIRVSDGFRTIRLPVSYDGAAGNHRRLVHGLRPAGARRHRVVCGWHSARAIADKFDLLWTRRRERASGTDHLLIRNIAHATVSLSA